MTGRFLAQDTISIHSGNYYKTGAGEGIYTRRTKERTPRVYDRINLATIIIIV